MIPDFRLGQTIRFVLNPTQKGMVIVIKLFADGGSQYEVDYLSPEGEFKTGSFFACELEMDDDV